jgi:Autotransporter beta-domain.
VEASRAFDVNRYLSVSPVAAFDYEHVWQKGYNEKDGLTAVKFRKTDLAYSAVRVGVNVDANLPGRFDLSARAYYSRQLDRDYAKSKQRFVNATTPTNGMNIWGVKRGKDNLNLGASGVYYLNDRKSAALYVNYDLDIKKRETTHTGNFGVMLNW